MIEIIYEKLSQVVDFFLGKWAKATDGRRGADDVSGFLWIVGVLLLMIDLCLKKKMPLFIVGCILIVYGLIRCFSNAEFHDVENTAFLKVILAIKNLFIKLFGFVGVKYAELKATDRKQIVEQIKEKVDKDEQKQLIEKRVEERAEERAEKRAIKQEKKELKKESENQMATPSTPVVTPETKTSTAPKTTPSPYVDPSVITSRNEAERKPAAPTPVVPPKPKTPEKTDKSTHYIFECPGCKRKVRIPNRGKKGRVAIVCPACNTRFVKMRW